MNDTFLCLGLLNAVQIFEGIAVIDSHQFLEANNADKGNKDTEISNTRGFPNSCLSEGNTGNGIPSDWIEEDPIADFSEEKLPCMTEGTAVDNLMTSPAKNKRDTSRTVNTLLSEQKDDMTKQSGTEQGFLRSRNSVPLI